MFAVVVLSGSGVSAAPAEGLGAAQHASRPRSIPVTGHVLCIEPLGATVAPAGGAALQRPEDAGPVGDYSPTAPRGGGDVSSGQTRSPGVDVGSQNLDRSRFDGTRRCMIRILMMRLPVCN